MAQRLDTSALGPNRLTPPGIRSRARALYAEALAAEAPGWRNAADNVRDGGLVNCWVGAGLRALEALLSQIPEDHDDPV